MSDRSVVVLGGGIGGVVAARELRRRLDRTVQVTVVNPSPTLTFAPSLLWVVQGRREPARISADLHRLERRGIRLEIAEAIDIDLGSQVVKTTAGSLPYSQLVIAVGADLAPAAMPGFAETAFNVYSLDGALACRDALRTFRGGRVVVLVSSSPYKCPAAPYEAALLVDSMLRERGVRDASDIELYTPEPQPLPVAGPVAGRQVTELLRSRGIALHTQRAASRIDAADARIVFADDETVSFDLLVGVPPHRAPEILLRSGLANGSGFVPVDRNTMQSASPGVYVLGDAAAVSLADGKPLPKAGVFAERQARVVAQRIAAELGGATPTAEFEGRGSCFLETGNGRAAFATGNFYAEDRADVRLLGPGRLWHLAKVAFERIWLRRWL